MKNLFLAFCVTVSALSAGASVTKKTIAPVLSAELEAKGWMPMSSICYRAQDYAAASTSCNDDARVTGMMSTEDVVISSSCGYASSRCPYGYQYQMDSRILFVNK